jgi:hypothetical protein
MNRDFKELEGYGYGNQVWNELAGRENPYSYFFAMS